MGQSKTPGLALRVTREGAPGQANLCLAAAVAVLCCSLSGCVYPSMRLRRFEKSRSNLVAPACATADICRGGADFWVVNARPCCVRAERFTPEQLGYGRIEPSSRAIQPLDRTAFLAGMDPTVPLCIFVHGYGYDFKLGLEDAHWAYFHLQQAAGDQRFQFLFFSWPTELEGPMLLPRLPGDVRVKEMRADITAHYLAWLLNSLPPAQSVCLIGHSLGARTVAGALHLLGGGEGAVPAFALPPSAPRRLHAVLLAPATGHEWFSHGHKFGMAPLAAQQILVLQNPRDAVLWWYPLVAWRCARCLGRHGLTRQDRRELGPAAEKIRVISVGRYLGWQHELPAYFGSSPITKLIGSALQFEPTEYRQNEGGRYGTR
jgi:hypothetical protein